MLTRETPISALGGIGPKTASKLRNLAISTVGDLVTFFPRRWEDFSRIARIASLRVGVVATIRGRVVAIHQRSAYKRRKMKITTVLLSDESGSIVAVWFNQPYATKDWRVGDEIMVSGKVGFGRQGLQFTNPLTDKLDAGDAVLHTGGIIPMYPQTAGINSKFLRKLIHPLLYKDTLDTLTPEYMPPIILKRNELMPLFEAIREMHFPTSAPKLQCARKRIGFDELLLIQTSLLLQKDALAQEKAPVITLDIELLKRFVTSLPYGLTNDQRKAIWDIVRDISRDTPMNRLIDGDVGSGKTAIALAAILTTVHAGYRAVLMAPTEILARQHHETASRLFNGFGVKVGLVAGKGKRLQTTTYKLQPDVVIGTHALFSEKARYRNIGLVIVDEQHRFGVEQRRTIREKAGLKNMMPHFLSMTATPIPRSLGLSLYGDLDMSIVREMPRDRKKVLTKYVSQDKRAKAYHFVGDKIKAGNQVFVVCSLIDTVDADDDRKTVIAEAKKMQKTLPILSVEYLHGKMRSEEKGAVMKRFKEGKTHILVATSVIEVGIDIPNANIIIIEDAERFGLAQLHQLRGRVGRGQQQAYCLLFSESNNEEAIERLNRFAEISDGFELSEYDLKLRGPGEFWGVEQSGFPRMKVATLWDRELVRLAREEARYILNQGLGRFPLLKHRVDELYQVKHFE